jgi:chromosome partitioning protein
VRIVAVINQKGGSGKTTTAVCTAGALAERGLTVLLVDLDPQASASAWLAQPSDDRSLFDALVGTRDLAVLAVETSVAGLQVVPSSPWLATAEQMLMGDLGVGMLRAIERLRRSWDFVILDCPPTLSHLSVGALMAVREVIIPVEARAIAVPGVAAVVGEMGRLRTTLNPGLRDPLILACRVNRTVHARNVVGDLRSSYGDRMARATVRETIRLSEAAAARMPITQYAPDSVGSHDYRAFVDELLERESGRPGAGLQSRLRRFLTRVPRGEASTRPA